MQLFVDNLTVIDCSYLHPIYGIEGESFIVDIALGGTLDAQSMIMDFGQVKKRIKQAIDKWVDHCLLVPKHAPQLQAYQANDNGVYLEWCDSQGRVWKHQSPHEALCEVDCELVSKESIVAYLVARLPEVISSNIDDIHIQLRHEAIDGPFYHYSHGLKKHDGNCQRIAHGHRSKLEIWKDGVLATQQMQAQCEDWQHVYLISQEDVIAEDEASITSAYDAPQGGFWLCAPRSACDILQTDSTVECIAQHLAQRLKAQEPEAQWCVKAYEGVQKGAYICL